MATLQKFKLLATQCAVAGSPSRSPTASPVIHLRRRKTLRMLLNKSASGSGRRDNQQGCSSPPPDRDSKKGKEMVVVSHKLKDLFVSSEDDGDRPTRNCASPAGFRRGGGVRPLSAAFRQRLLRRAWRPVLIAIPEDTK